MSTTDELLASNETYASSSSSPHRDAGRGFVHEVETGRLREVK